MPNKQIKPTHTSRLIQYVPAATRGGNAGIALCPNDFAAAGVENKSLEADNPYGAIALPSLNGECKHSPPRRLRLPLNSGIIRIKNNEK